MFLTSILTGSPATGRHYFKPEQLSAADVVDPLKLLNSFQLLSYSALAGYL
jgi:hypothetical protein